MNVYLAINAVQSALAAEGIGKNRKNNQQDYKFRGIDDMYNAIAPLLAKHKLCILPAFAERVVTERVTAKGGNLFYVNVAGTFTFVSAEDGSSHTVGPFYGEAMDSGDKATNKAQSASFKYMAMQTFCIPTEGDNDADATTHEVKATPLPRPIPANVEGHDGFAALSPEAQQAVREWAMEAIALVDAGEPAQAWEFLHEKCQTQEDKLIMWTQLPSNVRSKLQKAARPVKETA